MTSSLMVQDQCWTGCENSGRSRSLTWKPHWDRQETLYRRSLIQCAVPPKATSSFKHILLAFVIYAWSSDNRMEAIDQHTHSCPAFYVRFQHRATMHLSSADKHCFSFSHPSLHTLSFSPLMAVVSSMMLCIIRMDTLTYSWSHGESISSFL